MELLPQELENWYILPALRKEFSELLSVKYKLKQREIAKIIGVTEAAVSQYKKNKRGKDVQFCGEMKKEIDRSAEIVAKDKKSFSRELQKLFTFMREKGHICEIHRKFDNVPKKCDICFNKG